MSDQIESLGHQGKNLFVPMHLCVPAGSACQQEKHRAWWGTSRAQCHQDQRRSSRPLWHWCCAHTIESTADGRLSEGWTYFSACVSGPTGRGTGGHYWFSTLHPEGHLPKKSNKKKQWKSNRDFSLDQDLSSNSCSTVRELCDRNIQVM